MRRISISEERHGDRDFRGWYFPSKTMKALFSRPPPLWRYRSLSRWVGSNLKDIYASGVVCDDHSNSSVTAKPIDANETVNIVREGKYPDIVLQQFHPAIIRAFIEYSEMPLLQRKTIASKGSSKVRLLAQDVGFVLRSMNKRLSTKIRNSRQFDSDKVSSLLSVLDKSTCQPTTFISFSLR